MTICVDAGECLWCPDLPKRLKTMHSHWFSRKHGVVLFRDPGFAVRRVHYILKLDECDDTGFANEVGNCPTAEDHAPNARAKVTCKLFQVNDFLASLRFSEDQKVWTPEVCELVSRVDCMIVQYQDRCRVARRLCTVIPTIIGNTSTGHAPCVHLKLLLLE
jgi:hypothetical protein